MADLITRLKVDSTEYDAKIKRAAQGLQHYVQSAHDSGDVIGRLLGDTKKYVESLGNMTTVSTTARGRLNELTAAFTDLRTVYNSLSDEEKNAQGGFGQTLNKQLEILKNRINDTKKELKDIDTELGNTKQAEDGAKSGLEGLTSALGINLNSLAGWGAALTAGKVALDVAKDAFFASEATVDEWGRTVDASKSLYEGFLTALNTGDISGYLNNINQIVTAARAAYDELDRLGTMQTIQSPQKSSQQMELDRMRMMLQTGRYIAPIDGQKAAMKDGEKLTKEQLKNIQTHLQNGMKNMRSLIANEVKQTGKAIDAVYNRQAKELGMGIKEFRKGTSSMAEFDQRMEGYRKYLEWNKNAQGEFAKQGGQGYVNFDKSNPYAEFKKWGVFRVDGDRYKQLVQLIQQRDQQASQAYSVEGQMYRAMNRADNRINPNGSGIDKDEFTEVVGLIGTAQEHVKDLQKQISESWDEGEIARLTDDLKDAEAELQRLKDIGKGADLDKLFPDNSAKNYNTGYAGSIQAKVDSATVDMAMGPLNIDSVNAYIATMKSALKESDLGTPLYESLTEKLKDATTVSTLLQEMMERGLAGADLESTAQALKEKLLSPEGIDQTAIQPFLDELNKQIEEAGGVGLKLNADTGEVTDDKDKGKDDGEELKKFNEGVGKLTGGLSQVTGGLKAVGVEIPKEVDQVIGVVNGVSQIISGVGTIISIFGSTAITANTTAVGLNTAAIGTLIAAIEFNTATNFIPFFAGGGIVPHAAGGYLIPGNNMSGDNVFAGNAWVNSGELVLSKAQQGNLASQLTDAERGIGGGAQPYLDGELIYLGLQAYMRRSGLGEIVTAER